MRVRKDAEQWDRYSKGRRDTSGLDTSTPIAIRPPAAVLKGMGVSRLLRVRLRVTCGWSTERDRG